MGLVTTKGSFPEDTIDLNTSYTHGSIAGTYCTRCNIRIFCLGVQISAEIVLVGDINATVSPPMLAHISYQPGLLESLGYVFVAFVGLLVLMILSVLVGYLYDKCISQKCGELQSLPFFQLYNDDLKEYKIQDKDSKTRMFYLKDWYFKENLATPKLNSLMQTVFGKNLNFQVPSNIRVISIRMEGFQHGKFCHDFEPICGRSFGSYYTYQTYGNKRIQVTRYVENRVSYVAGFCIYVKDENVLGCNFSEEVVKKIMDSERYSGKALSGINKTLKDIESQEEFDKIWNLVELPKKTKWKKSKTKQFEEFPGINDFNWV